MTKLSSVFAKIKTKMNNKQFLALWLLFHGAVFAFFGITYATSGGKIKIDADLMNMLPSSFDETALQVANDRLTDFVGKNLYILVSNPSLDQAKADATKIYNEFKNSDNFSSVTMEIDLSGYSDTAANYLYDYRWNLLNLETSQKILDGGDQEFAENALAKAYGAINLTSLDNLDTDPFLLEDTVMNQYLDILNNSGTHFTIKDGFIAAQVNDLWYIMLKMYCTEKGLTLAGDDNAVSQVYSVCTPIENSGNGTRFVFTGVPFQSQESSTTAIFEIELISTISFAIVIIILLLVFRDFTPLLFSLLSIAVSLLTAITGTLALFHKIHILTLVFGTSLIGSCIDYSLHFFVNWKANTELSNGSEVRTHLFKGLFLSLLSTILCYGVMAFISYNLIKQMGFFSIVGLISSFLTTVSIYPFIKMPTKDRKIGLVKLMDKPSWWNKKKIGRYTVTFMFAIPIILILFFNKNATIYNDLNSLYTMKGRILADENESHEVMHFAPHGWFVIRGDTPEEALEVEETLRLSLADYRDSDGRPLGYLSTTSFLPSIEAQKKSREACLKLMESVEYQMEALGYDAEDAQYVWESFNSSEGKYLTMDSEEAPSAIFNMFDAIWLGEIDGHYYTVLMPIYENNVAAFRDAATIDDRIFYANEVVDVSENLDKLTRRILIVLIITFLALFVLLKLFYTIKQSLKIISIPFLILLMVYAVFSVAKVHLEFFSIIGIVLVLGLGLDYIIYMIENENKSRILDQTQTLEPFGILFSFFTTAVSFGALSLSSFVPVHMIGLSIFIGLSTAYAASFFYDRS